MPAASLPGGERVASSRAANGTPQRILDLPTQLREAAWSGSGGSASSGRPRTPGDSVTMVSTMLILLPFGGQPTARPLPAGFGQG